MVSKILSNTLDKLQKLKKYISPKTVIIIILIIAVIIALIIAKYVTSNRKEEFFTYQALYNGEPNSNILTDSDYNALQGSSYLPATSTSILDIAGNSKDTLLAILFAMSSTITTKIYKTNTPTTVTTVTLPNQFNNLLQVTKSNNTEYRPLALNCAFNDVGYSIAINSTTYYYLNSALNENKLIGVLIYFSLDKPDVFYYLELPRVANTTTTTANTTNTVINYIKPRTIAVNDDILFMAGCDNKLYYCKLNNGVPSSKDASNWKMISSDNMGMISNVKNISLNDNILLVQSINIDSQTSSGNNISYTNINTFNSSGDITVNWQKWISVDTISTTTVDGSIINLNPFQKTLQNITVNNNVCWGYDNIAINTNATGSSNGIYLWWCTLNNKIPINVADRKWNFIQLNRNYISSIENIALFNNKLIVSYTSSGNNRNLSIPLYSTSSNSTSTAPNTTNNGATTSTTPTTTNNGATTSTTPTTTNNGATTSTTPTTTNGGSGSGSSGSGSGSSGSGSGSSGSGSNDITTTMPSTTIATTTTARATTTTKSLTYQDVLNNDLKGMLDGIDILGNKDNSMLSGNSMIGNNLYISPMDSPSMYTPQGEFKGKIKSVFFPMVQIDK